MSYQIQNDFISSDVFVVNFDAGDSRRNLSEDDFLELESVEAVPVQSGLDRRLHRFRDHLHQTNVMATVPKS